MLTLEDCRRFYAEEIEFAAALNSPELVTALARIPREKFLGPGPWDIAMPDMVTGTVRYLTTPDDDPRHVYHNVVIALDRSRDLTNGQPGTLLHYINALDLSRGNRVFHLGTGSGYYTAIIAEVVGQNGSVIASEVHSELGAMAAKNLQEYANIEVRVGDGMQVDPGDCDAMLINAGVTHPLPLWLDRLRIGGRLLLPITMPMAANLGKGVMLKVIRQDNGYSAQMVTFVAIYSATSGRDPKREALLGKALGTGVLMRTRSVRRDEHEPGETCALHGDEVCLSMALLPES